MRPMKALTDRHIPIWAFLLTIAVSCALLLALPGQTITTRYLADLFVILDGAYRVTSGLVPSHDFHTPLGPLVYYLPAAGYLLSGSLGSAMPTAMALVTLALSLPMIHVLGSRLHPLIAILFGAFLVLVLAVPINLGESITALTFAKFYNRIGWAALGILLVMYVRPVQPSTRQEALDALCSAALTLVMLYTKLTYGIVAMTFLVFMLTDRTQRRWAFASLAFVIVTCSAIEAVWQSSFLYLRDIHMALDVGGRLRGTWGQIAEHISGNLADYVLLLLLSAFALRRSHSFRDGLFYLFCAVTGFLIINQNFQAWGILTIHAASAVAVETILRQERAAAADAGGMQGSISAGAKLLFLALVLPTIVHCTAALGLHTISASIRAGEDINLSHLDNVRLANLWSWSDFDTANLYITSIRDGAEVLSETGQQNGGIFALDLANPYPMILGAAPPKGDMPWLQWDRTLNASFFIPAASLLEHVNVVMEPKPADSSSLPAGLKILYGPYIESHFELLRETDHWKVYRRRGEPAPEAAMRDAEPS